MSSPEEIARFSLYQHLPPEEANRVFMLIKNGQAQKALNILEAYFEVDPLLETELKKLLSEEDA